MAIFPNLRDLDPDNGIKAIVLGAVPASATAAPSSSSEPRTNRPTAIAVDPLLSLQLRANEGRKDLDLDDDSRRLQQQDPWLDPDLDPPWQDPAIGALSDGRHRFSTLANLDPDLDLNELLRSSPSTTATRPPRPRPLQSSALLSDHSAQSAPLHSTGIFFKTPLPSARDITACIGFLLFRLDFDLDSILDDDLVAVLKYLGCPVKLTHTGELYPQCSTVEYVPLLRPPQSLLQRRPRRQDLDLDLYLYLNLRLLPVHRHRSRSEVQVVEARAFYGFQTAIEKIPSTQAKAAIRSAKDSDPWIQRRAHLAFLATQGMVSMMSPPPPATATSPAFCAIFWLKKRGLMAGLISRDEGLHCDFACLLYSLLNNKLAEERVKGMVKEAVDIEREFVCDDVSAAAGHCSTELLRSGSRSTPSSALLLLRVEPAAAFYLPVSYPHKHAVNDPLFVKVNSLLLSSRGNGGAISEVDDPGGDAVDPGVHRSQPRRLGLLVGAEVRGGHPPNPAQLPRHRLLDLILFIDSDPSHSNHLINMHSKCGHLPAAHMLFDEMPQQVEATQSRIGDRSFDLNRVLLLVHSRTLASIPIIEIEDSATPHPNGNNDNSHLLPPSSMTRSSKGRQRFLPPSKITAICDFRGHRNFLHLAASSALPANTTSSPSSSLQPKENLLLQRRLRDLLSTSTASSVTSNVESPSARSRQFSFLSDHQAAIVVTPFPTSRRSRHQFSRLHPRCRPPPLRQQRHLLGPGLNGTGLAAGLKRSAGALYNSNVLGSHNNFCFSKNRESSTAFLLSPMM